MLTGNKGGQHTHRPERFLLTTMMGKTLGNAIHYASTTYQLAGTFSTNYGVEEGADIKAITKAITETINPYINMV